MLSTNEVAEQMGVAYTTVMLWIKQGKLEAIRREHPRGAYYEIPVTALKKLDRGQKGRPRKEAAGASAAEGVGHVDKSADGDQVTASGQVEVPADEAKPRRKASKRSPAKKAMKKSAKKGARVK